VNAARADTGSEIEPTKIANAARRETLWEAIRTAIANEKTIPTFANVRSRPDAMPYSSPGAGFMTAELFAGKNAPAPAAPRRPSLLSVGGRGGRARVTDSAATSATHRGTVAAFAVDLIETVALAVAAALSGSVAMRAQTAANAADLAVQVFLLIGLFSSARAADTSHPLGYGRERFFWSLLAALGIFLGGGVVALDGAVKAGLHPSAITHYAATYAVLASTLALDAVALEVAVRPLRRDARARGIPLLLHLRPHTDPASTTVLVGGACALAAGVVAMLGLLISQETGASLPDTIASALIGGMLLSTSALLLHMNRELLSGRGVSLAVARDMRELVASEPGVVEVPDLFAVVVGPSSLIVNGDVVFADHVDISEVETTLMRSATLLRQRWPSIDYVYLTPVGQARPRRAPWTRRRAAP
jgi:cation diffusion facilitator family transporter